MVNDEIITMLQLQATAPGASRGFRPHRSHRRANWLRRALWPASCLEVNG